MRREGRGGEVKGEGKGGRGKVREKEKRTFRRGGALGS